LNVKKRFEVEVARDMKTDKDKSTFRYLECRFQLFLAFGRSADNQRRLRCEVKTEKLCMMSLIW
jgi:hypothetical protein